MENAEQATQDETAGGNADQGSGERPESPEEATTPPGNPDPDPEKVQQVEEDVDATKPY